MTRITTDEEAAARIQAEGWSSTPVVEISRGGNVVAAWQGFRSEALKALGAGPEADMGAFDMWGV